MKKNLLTTCFLVLLSFESFSQITLPSLISDSMVLQRNTKLKIWGWASPGEKIVIDFAGKRYHTTTKKDSTWVVRMSPLKAGGPYNMLINGTNHKEIRNIMMGDVWICGGQSNMELPMDRVSDLYPGEITNAGNPFIRHYRVPVTYSFGNDQRDPAKGKWETVHPLSLGRFTATGYFFAKEIYERTKVPIGLILNAAGGSSAQSWLSEEELIKFPHYLNLYKQYSVPGYFENVRNSIQHESNSWYSRLYANDQGSKENPKWYENSFKADDWKTIELPGYWKDKGVGNVHGVLWFRKDIQLDQSATNIAATLHLGNIVDRDSVYINGVFIGTTGYQYPPRKYRLQPGILIAGQNTITIKVINSGGAGGFYPGKDYKLVWGSDSIDLKGNWQYKIGAISDPLPPAQPLFHLPGAFYKTMVLPLFNFSIKGVIWYQGESNAGNGKEYQQLFPDLIREWRDKWQQGNFPFLYVQLANYMEAKREPGESGWAELREAQRKTLSLPQTALAVAIDIGEWNDLHPRNKKEVGRRLSLAARKLAYGEKKLVHSGPLYKKMRVEGKRLILSFDHLGDGLEEKNGPLSHFAIAGPDMKYKWAKAVIEGNEIVVWNEEIPQPVAVRYAWADNPTSANLYNKNGLPASPFSTQQ